MLILLALSLIVAVAAMHRYLQSYAPTNLLSRSVRAHEPRWSAVALLTVLVAALLVVMHMLGEAVANGGPGWLNLAVLVLAWDVIKLGILAVVLAGRCSVRGCLRRWRDFTRQPSTPQGSRTTASA